MKSLLLFLCGTIIFSCGQSGSGADSSSEESSPYGAFSRGGADTLWVREYESMMEPQIDFQFYAENERVSYNLADYAVLSESTDETVLYTFSDSSEYSVNDLELTFSYETGNWSVNDLAAKKYAEKKMNLSGEWMKANAE